MAELAPKRILGRATGAQGIAIAASQMAGLPLGLAIMERWSATPVFVLGALIPALALVAIAGLPKIFAQPTGESVRLSVFAVLVPVLGSGVCVRLVRRIVVSTADRNLGACGRCWSGVGDRQWVDVGRPVLGGD